MQIKELSASKGNCNITADVIDKGDIREFQKFGKSGRVCNARIRDSSGEVSLTLWNEQIDQVNPGDKVKVTNGWCSEFQGELQLSTGKFGKLEVEKGAQTEDEKTESDVLSGVEKEKPAKKKEMTSDEIEEDIDVTEEEVE